MAKPSKFALAMGLLALVLAATADAAPATKRAARQPAPPPSPKSSYSYDNYGLAGDCTNHPFSRGCDRRGVW